MHYYSFNIADYRKDTAHLNIAEHGIYRQLIDWYYLDEKPIPIETQVVMRRLSLGSDMLHNLQNVLSDFFLKTEIGYCHSRIEIEIEHYKAKSAKNKVNGALGGRPLKTQVVSEEKPKQKRKQSESKGNQEPITNNQQPNTITRAEAEFAEFWQAYPNGIRGKSGKAVAFKAWQKMKPNLNEVLRALHWQSKSKEWTKQNGQFIPNPSSYLNQSKWQDEPPKDAFIDYIEMGKQ